MSSGALSRCVQNHVAPSRRRLGSGEQAAAVCYRVSKRGIEFLLVRTRSGRWTFPKGGIEPGLTCAQSAALEAFEEAGVHGRMEVVAFARYLRQMRSKQNQSVSVLAYLCEVQRLGKPQEANRNRTWFPVDKAKRRLREGRTSECGAQLAVVVDRAVARLLRLGAGCDKPRTASGRLKDGLQRVCFEASEAAWWRKAAAVGRFVPRALQSPATIETAADAPVERLLPRDALALRRPMLRLVSGNRPAVNADAQARD